MKKYREKKAAGEKNIGLEPEKLEVVLGCATIADAVAGADRRLPFAGQQVSIPSAKGKW